MGIDKKLKQELLEILQNSQESMPVYSIKKLSYTEMIHYSRYYASRFMGRDSDAPFRCPHREDDLTLIKLSLDTKMRIYHNSNTVIIRRRMDPLENLIGEKSDIKQLSEIAIDEINKLELEKKKLPFEHVEFERLWQIKASSMTIEKTKEPILLCRIIGAFRRHINKIPVYGAASIFIKIAGGRQIESIGIDWRQINEKPINRVKIIDPDIAAEKVLKNLNFNSNMVVTPEDYKPVFFALGYYSMPKRQQQNYMQPVYVAMFESLASTLNMEIVIPATTHTYEPVSIAPQARKSKKG